MRVTMVLELEISPLNSERLYTQLTELNVPGSGLILELRLGTRELKHGLVNTAMLKIGSDTVGISSTVLKVDFLNGLPGYLSPPSEALSIRPGRIFGNRQREA